MASLCPMILISSSELLSYYQSTATSKSESDKVMTSISAGLFGGAGLVTIGLLEVIYLFLDVVDPIT